MKVRHSIAWSYCNQNWPCNEPSMTVKSNTKDKNISLRAYIPNYTTCTARRITASQTMIFSTKTPPALQMPVASFDRNNS